MTTRKRVFSNSFTLQVKSKDGKSPVTYRISLAGSTFSHDPNTDTIYVNIKGKVYKTVGGVTSAYTALSRSELSMYFEKEDGSTDSVPNTDSIINGFKVTSSTFESQFYNESGYTGEKVFVVVLTVDGKEVASESIQITKDGQKGNKGDKGDKGDTGSSGSAGKMCYIAGEYDDKQTYTSNASETVAVEVENSNGEVELYILEAATNVVNNVHIGPTDGRTDIWRQGLNNYNLIRAKYLFSDFAQLGSFIVSQDFFFSQHGTLVAFGDAVAVSGRRSAGKVYMKTVDGKRVPYYAVGSNSGNDRPCYTFFNAADPMAEDVLNGPVFTLEGNSIDGTVVVKRVWFMASAATQVNITVTPSSEADYDWGAVGELDSTALSADGVTASKVKNDITPTLIKASGTTQRTMTLSVGAGLHFFEIAYLKDGSSDDNDDNAVFTFSESGNNYIAGFSMMAFRPMKVVNALTGEEWGAGGNFTLSANGDVRVNGIVRAKSMETTFVDLTDKYRKEGSSYVALDGGTGSPGEYVLGEDVYELVNGSYVKCDISGIYNFVVGNTVFILPSDSQYISQRVLLFNGNMDTSGGTSKGPRVVSYEYDEGLTTTRYLRGIGKEVKYNSNNSSVPSNHVLPSGSAVPVWSFDAVTSLFFVNGAVELIAVPDTEDAALCEWAVVNIGTNCYMID